MLTPRPTCFVALALVGLGSLALPACVHYGATGGSPSATPPLPVADAPPPPLPPPPPSAGPGDASPPPGEASMPIGAPRAEEALAGSVIAMLESSCSSGNQGACVGVGMAYWNGGMGIQKDPAKGRGYLQRACDQGDQSGCTVLKAWVQGKGFMPGEQVLPLDIESTTVTTTSDDGSTFSSSTGGDAAQEALGTGMLRSACQNGDQEACVGAGVLYWHGLGVPRDRARGRQYLQQACDHGAQNGCQILAKLGH